MTVTTPKPAQLGRCRRAEGRYSAANLAQTVQVIFELSGFPRRADDIGVALGRVSSSMRRCLGAVTETVQVTGEAAPWSTHAVPSSRHNVSSEEIDRLRGGSFQPSRSPLRREPR